MKNLHYFFILLYAPIILLGRHSYAQDAGINWPEGKKAVVCLTYDDGILSQLDHAIPDLDAAGFKGTFYLTGSNLRAEHIERWREAAENGHELGCHSLFHPCSGEMDWVPDEYQTEDYTFRRILDEASLMNKFLYAIDGKSKRTYAYPCNETEVGGINYVDTLRGSGLFVGARAGAPSAILSAKCLNRFQIHSMSVTNELPFEEVVDQIEEAVNKRSVAVFCFHGIGGDYILTSREYHQNIIKYLKEREEEILVIPVVDLANFLKMQD